MLLLYWREIVKILSCIMVKLFRCRFSLQLLVLVGRTKTVGTSSMMVLYASHKGWKSNNKFSAGNELQHQQKKLKREWKLLVLWLSMFFVLDYLDRRISWNRYYAFWIYSILTYYVSISWSKVKKFKYYIWLNLFKSILLSLLGFLIFLLW